MEAPITIPNCATVTVTRNEKREVMSLRLTLADGTVVHDWVRPPLETAYVVDGSDAIIHHETVVTQTLLNRTGGDIPFYLGWSEPLRQSVNTKPR